MTTRLLLDTHVLVRWLAEPRRLSREQARLLEAAVRRREPVAISAITLLELALLCSEGVLRSKLSLDQLFSQIQADPAFEVLPLTFDVAHEAAQLGPLLRDPADRVIVATARTSGLRLLTSDQRIVDSRLVSTVD